MEKMTAFLWYLCCPFTCKDDPAKEAFRVRRSTEAAIELDSAGVRVFSPITYTKPLVEVGKMGGTWEDWQQHDLALLSHCDGVLILALEGWDHSVGVKAECDFARDHHMPIVPIQDWEWDDVRVLDSITRMQEVLGMIDRPELKQRAADLMYWRRRD